jgi:hypothetical protein
MPMAKVLERHGTLYDEDLLAWAEQQAAHLRASQLDRLDAAHLIEELEGMAASRRRKVKRRLRVLLMHLLKWDFQPRRRSRSWASTIAEQRARIEDLLEESPSLRPELEATARAAYPQALKRAAIETGLPRQTFPADLRYDLSRILGDEDGPDGAMSG